MNETCTLLILGKRKEKNLQKQANGEQLLSQTFFSMPSVVYETCLKLNYSVM
jgi:hypothetical protein